MNNVQEAFIGNVLQKGIRNLNQGLKWIWKATALKKKKHKQ